MYSQWITVFPKHGCENETQKVLEDWAIKAHERGDKLAISRRIYYSDEPTFTIVIVQDDLKSMQKMRDRNASDPVFHDYLTSQTSCTSRAGSVELYKFLVPPKNAGGKFRYTHGVHVYPSTGTVRETWNILEKEVMARQNEGRPGIRLLQKQISDNGPAFFVMDTYQNLAEYEDTKMWELVGQTGPLARTPAMNSISEVIVPMP